MIKNFTNILIWLFKFTRNLPKNIYVSVKELVLFCINIVYLFIIFILIVGFYLSTKLLSSKLMTLPFMPVKLVTTMQVAYFKFYSRVLKLIDSKSEGSISKLDLMDLAIKNMIVKKTRALITIGGVAIVFLVSIGYGLQELVISKVARLDELRQADVSVRAGSKMKINDKIVTDIKGLTNVVEVLPLIAAVGRVSYQNSSADVAVFGVTTNYLENSAIKPTKGELFESREIVYIPGNEDTQEDQPAEELGYVVVNIGVGQWIAVRESTKAGAPIIGYTKQGTEDIIGLEALGENYIGSTDTTTAKDSKGNTFGKWVKAKYYLWERTDCEVSNIYCVDSKYLMMRDPNGVQKNILGYITETGTEVKKYEGTPPNESGTTAGLDIVATGDPNFVEIPSETATTQQAPVKKVSLASNSIKQAIVNRSMLTLLGIKEDEAVGKEFEVSYIITSDLLTDAKEKVESTEASYKIVGITPDDNAPIFYVPFIDLRSLGITNYSQIKVIARDKESLDAVRKQIDALGFITNSVVDTVSQITGLFKTIRAILGVMGTVALVVAALGMFNTFTVSLLERTREVGLMKAIGMKSTEVQELFLIEALIMGFGGGIGGVILGFILGKLLSSALSVVSVSKGLGVIDVTYIPNAFILLILFLSLFIGAVTGLYPARRARTITALNALRYE